MQVLTSIPAYSSKNFRGTTEEEYQVAVDNFRETFNKAVELFEAYWRTGNDRLFDMSLEALEKAWMYMEVLVDKVTEEALLVKLCNRGTFTYDMAAVMMGATKG